jgi:hypothetical protein
MTLTPVGDPDDPDLVIGADQGSLRDEDPVPGHDHFERIDTEREENLIDGTWSVSHLPEGLVRQNDSHDLIILGEPGA